MFEKIKEEHPGKPDREIERQIQKMSEADLEKQGFFGYQDETHIPRVVEEILKNWDFQSQNKEFNAILTVD